MSFGKNRITALLGGEALVDRGSAVMAKLRELVQQNSASRFQIAQLLYEVREHKYWKDRYSTFTAYLKEELDISVRTAQQMTKVIITCHRVGIPLMETEKVGWSKLSIIADSLTERNAQELIEKAGKLSFRQLQELSKELKVSKGVRSKERVTDKLTITAEIQEALSVAAQFTRVAKKQTNFEFLAKWFLERIAPESSFNRPSDS